MRRSRSPRRPLAGALALTVGLVTLAGGGPSAQAAPAPDRYEITAGDTLSELAETLGTSVADLAAANGIDDPDLVVAGTVLDVPDQPSSSSSGGTPVPASRQHLAAVFDRWAGANGISPSLLKALCWNESGWQADVVSSAGADGVCQLMPDTEDHMEALIGRELDSSDPEDNIRLGARYLRWLLVRTDGDVREALGGYYQGLGAMERHGPYDETVAYVDTVLALRERFR